jgi:VWFA-related protein
MVFDDVHMSMQDTAFVRDSATRFFGALAPSDRVAINSTSGQLTQDFTDDHETLRKALLGILPRPTHVDAACPDMPYYEADLIANRNDIQALGVATQETLQCAFGGDQRMLTTAQAMAQAAAQVAVSQGDNETEFTYRRMEETLRRLTAMPGQRIVVFVSPGFFLTTMENTASDLIDRATRANVVINTIDARGLYTPDSLGDIANPPAETGLTAGYKSTYRITAQGLQDDVLAQLADGTGGSFYHNRNDVEEAMRQAGAAPEISYLLGFSPQNLKADGRYHTLKVSLTSKQKYTLQARHGFYAPRTIADPAEAAKQEIQDALFSQDELLEFPLDFHTQFFKVDPATAKVAVVAHLDIKGLPLRKDAGRNNDRLTIMTGFFDENGQYVTGVQKIVDMKLRDTTYEQLKRMGLNLKTSFDIRPGTYLVRVVVRDSEGAQMAARNGSVVIPN